VKLLKQKKYSTNNVIAYPLSGSFPNIDPEFER
jgi:hypothetical protein